jgi:hypothetical protein
MFKKNPMSFGAWPTAYKTSNAALPTVSPFPSIGQKAPKDKDMFCALRSRASKRATEPYYAPLPRSASDIYKFDVAYSADSLPTYPKLKKGSEDTAMFCAPRHRAFQNENNGEIMSLFFS